MVSNKRTMSGPVSQVVGVNNSSCTGDIETILYNDDVTAVIKPHKYLE